MNKYCVSVFIYIYRETDKEFLEYESLVLPLLEKHNGRLLQRFRPSDENIFPAGKNVPFEIHVIEFDTETDFESYKNDPKRKKHSALAEKCIKKTEIFELIH